MALGGLVFTGPAVPTRAPAPRQKAGGRQVLVVGNSYSGTVSLIDVRTLRRLGRPMSVIPDGSTPRDPRQAKAYPTIISSRGEVNYAQEVALSPDGSTLYVSRGYLGDVAAFSLRTHKLLWRLQTPGLRADHLALAPGGRRLFVSVLPGTRVYAIDTRSHRFVGSYEAGDFPHVLEFSPDGQRLYSGSLGDQLAPYGHDHGRHKLVVADPRTLKVVRTYRFPAGVRPFAFLPGGQRLVLQLSYFNGFREIDLRTGQTVRNVRLPLRGPARSLPAARYPNAAAHHGLAVNGDTVCDAGTISNYVALVSVRTGRTRRIIPVGQAPGEAISSLDGRYCFVTDRGPTGLNRPAVSDESGDAVSVISYARAREVRRIQVGRHPQSETVGRISDSTLRAGGFRPPGPQPREPGALCVRARPGGLTGRCGS